MNWLRGALVLVLLLVAYNSEAQALNLPTRATNAPTGSEFAKSIAALERGEREEKIYEQVAQGNVPPFLRKLVSVQVQSVQEGKTNRATYYVIPDYLAIGSDEDYFLAPLSPIMAQRVADLVHYNLPTRKMVDDIYAAAQLKLVPSPIPPSPAMATVPIFIQHNQTVWGQRKEQLAKYHLGTLVGGDKKDVVIANKLNANPGKVAIYGWHKLDGKAIQPVYTGHADTYADYSHGIRLVQMAMEVNGASKTVAEVLADANLAGLLSDEGVVSKTRYATTAKASITNKAVVNVSVTNKQVTLKDFQAGAFDERSVSYVIEPEIKVHINAPAKMDAHRNLKLVIYTLPNGNTTEQTIGRKIKEGEDWHFNIQHIGAQTRFLRERLKEEDIVVAYLEAGKKSWPTWRKEHADQPRRIPEVVESIKSIFKGREIQTLICGHSGGGSFIFGYINGVEQIPEGVERIIFLDSNYAYDEAQGHKDKLMKWLKASDQHHLVVLAYNDAIALLNGKPFVSAAGGTWGRSHRMVEDLGKEFKFINKTNDGFETYIALDGRMQFLLKENPEKKIFHTVQVERNGFIHGMVSGTTNEGKGYVYFGPRAYTNWIAAE
ncbi:MAG: hypothetical protein JWQ71_3770 [Pedosphaera sp.]|nr:hypothetical protein [Pedosphaera sp.]